MYVRIFQETQLDSLTLRSSELKQHKYMVEQSDTQEMLP